MSYEILTVDQREPVLRRKMRSLLLEEDIRPDPHLDYSYVMVDDEDNVLATGSLFRNTLRCLAVRSDLHGEGLMGRLVAHLLQVELERGFHNSFLCTKPEYKDLMRDMGFYEIVSVPGVIFMESRRDGFKKWVASLQEILGPADTEKRCAIVMNANPFTRGHRYLAEQAAASSDRVVVFLVEEENDEIPFSVRLKLAKEGLADLPNVTVLPSSPYIISQATFPSYFLKDANEAAKAPVSVDLAVFRRFAPELGITQRWVGEEPESPVTRLYNETMLESLPLSGIECHVIPRLTVDGRLISARTVRAALREGDMETVREMTPESTYTFFASEEGQELIQALREKNRAVKVPLDE